MAEKSKILIIGATGYIGKFIVEASSKHGHPTFVLVRETTASDPKKSEVIQNFKNLGVSIIYVSNYSDTNSNIDQLWFIVILFVCS